MSTAVPPHSVRIDAPSPGVSNAYGHFSPDGREFIIADWKTPRPWCNIISNERIGLAVSQTGSGFSWIDNSQLGVITRWQQQFAEDSSGKFLYVRDMADGRVWSLSPAPTFPNYDRFSCRHGLGYTTFETDFAGIRASWTLFVHPTDTIEYWLVEFTNLTDRPRSLELSASLEWNCGVQPSPRREFHKLFIETEFDGQRGAIIATNHMWDVPAQKWGHWNTPFPYVAALAGTEPVLAAQGDMSAFLGRYGHARDPQALSQDRWRSRFGRHDDPIAVLKSAIQLRPNSTHRAGYALITGGDARKGAPLAAAASARKFVEQAIDQRLSLVAIDSALADAKTAWQKLLSAERFESPEPSLNYLINDWVRYQAIAGRIWGRAGYYQQSGAYGFRDQLQDSQVWLTIDPRRCRDQLNLHAQHQFKDGSVYHWWHPLSEMGLITRMTDDLLWLAFVCANYIRETGDFSVLLDETPFLDDPTPTPLIEHVRRAFARVFGRTSPRGIPFMGAGDWNDGLNAVGLQERGESFWLGMFLAGLLKAWSEITQRAKSSLGRSAESTAFAQFAAFSADFDPRRTTLINAINTHGWDGNWYLAATLDDGSLLGSHTNDQMRIYLNTQTWAILNDIAPAERAARCAAAWKEHLVSHAGALLLQPAFSTPREDIGYITRYAPGLRENGGVYTHAATWAIAAAAKSGDGELVGRLLTAINPANKDPEKYWAEPYVLPGNVDGPDSPYHGRGGWTWYTGSAQWLHRVVTHWVLGVRPTLDGLRIAPCLPPSWGRVTLTRPWRGNIYDFEIRAGAAQSPTITIDGQALSGNIIPPPKSTGGRFRVQVS